jgi:hypothetical protein
VVDNLSEYVQDDMHVLRTDTRETRALAGVDLSGLLPTERGNGNMERRLADVAVEGEGDGYQQVPQFISDSPGDPCALMTAVACQMSTGYAGQATDDVQEVGSLMDASAHLKKGTPAVGVARQSAGVIGKVDNCHVGGYARLVWQTRTSLLTTRRYLPACWTEDDARGKQAGLPPTDREHNTKPQLA